METQINKRSDEPIITTNIYLSDGPALLGLIKTYLRSRKTRITPNRLVTWLVDEIKEFIADESLEELGDVLYTFLYLRSWSTDINTMSIIDEAVDFVCMMLRQHQECNLAERVMLMDQKILGRCVLCTFIKVQVRHFFEERMSYDEAKITAQEALMRIGLDTVEALDALFRHVKC